MAALTVIIATLALAVVLLHAGLAKIRGRLSPNGRGDSLVDELSQWRILGVPAPVRHAWVVRAHPWGEVLLAVALLVLPGQAGVLAAAGVLALCLVYWVVIARAVVRRIPTSCSCFGVGRRSPVTIWALVRNTLLVGLAVLVLVMQWRGHSTPGAVADVGWAGLLPLLAAAAAAALLALVAVESQPTVQASPAAPPAPAPEDGDYVRMRTPALALMRPDGTEVALRQLSSERPALLLFVSTTCGSCVTVAAQVPAWRDELPMVDLWLVTRGEATAVREARPDWEGVLLDPRGVVASSLDAAMSPTAVLLGVDGLLAGGPETGPVAIEQLVADIHAALVGQPSA